MSNCQNNTVKKSTRWLAFVAYIIVCAAVVASIFGVKGAGVFNTSVVLDDVKTVTVSMNQYVYLTQLDEVEEECEKAFGDTKFVYQMKGEMSGDESEIIYVFKKDVDVNALKDTLTTAFDAETWDNAHIFVGANSEESVTYLAKNYVLRGVIAGLVLVALVYIYGAIRFGIAKGLTIALGTFTGLVLTVAILILTRIPVTVSISYVFAVTALLSAITSIISMGKIAASEKSENGNVCSCASKEILPICSWTCVALLVLALFATKGVASFALTSVVAVIVATVVGLKGVPAFYLPIKKVADAQPDKDAYVGAEKTSTKAKKVFKKEAKVVPVKETVAAPVEETVETVEEAVEEATAEVVEEAAEEATAEVVEETVEEATAEVVEEVAEEATEEVAEESTEE